MLIACLPFVEAYCGSKVCRVSGLGLMATKVKGNPDCADYSTMEDEVQLSLSLPLGWSRKGADMNLVGEDEPE